MGMNGMVQYERCIFSDSLKATSVRFGITHAFRNDTRLSRLTPFQEEKYTCMKKHSDLSELEAVYQIPLACGFCYVG